MSLIGSAVLVVSLGIGMVGYHYTEDLRWIDSFANAAMILSGMGPLDPLDTLGGKLFAGTYALFSGLAFISAIGVGIAPIVHRLFHRFHLELEEGGKRDALS
jgi:hypothetical protein